jgi:phosphoesterase RecJ-like protein
MTPAGERFSPFYRRELARFARVLRTGRTFFLTGHENPDGDTVGSEIAMADCLRARGKTVVVGNASPVPAYCRFLKGIRRVRSARRFTGRYDVAIVFECSGAERTGHVLDFKRQARTVVNVDHHAHHALYGDINLIDVDASSNSEQLLRVFDALGHRPTVNEATALYLGLVTDTGRFQQENTRVGSHRAAARLLEVGVDVADVHRHVYGTRSLAAMRLMGRALADARLSAGGRVTVLRLSRKDFAATGADASEIEDIPNLGLLPPTSWVSLFLRETAEPGKVKISLRGKSRVDLCRLAVSLGGGGHKNASGAVLPGSLDAVERKLVALLARSFKTK